MLNLEIIEQFIRQYYIHIIPVSLLFILFFAREKTAWINLKGRPNVISIKEFKGSIFSEIRSIKSAEKKNFGCIIENDTPIFIELNNKIYDLDINEFKIIYDGTNKNSRNHIYSSALMDFDVLNLKSNINLKSSGNVFTKEEKDKLMNITIFNCIEDANVRICENRYKITFCGNKKLYIKNKLIDLKQDNIEIQFTNKSKDESASSFSFKKILNGVYFVNREDEYIAFSGSCKEFDGEMKRGIVEFNQNNKEKSYKIDLRKSYILSCKNQYLALKYQNDEKNQLEINGNIKRFEICGYSLFLNFRGWINENRTAIIMVILTTYLGAIISK